MKTSAQLLAQVVEVLGHIDSTMHRVERNLQESASSKKGEKTTVTIEKPQQPSKPTKTATAGVSTDLNNLVGNKKSSEQIRDTGDSLRILASSLPQISKNLIIFSLIPKKVKRSFIDFVQELLSQSIFQDVSATDAAYTTSHALAIISNSLDNLSIGIKKFGKISGPEKDALKNFVNELFSLSIYNDKSAAESSYIFSEALTNIGEALQLFFGVYKDLDFSGKPIDAFKSAIHDIISMSSDFKDLGQFDTVADVFKNLLNISDSLASMGTIDISTIKTLVEDISSIKTGQDFSGIAAMFEVLNKISNYSVPEFKSIDISNIKKLIEDISSIKINEISNIRNLVEQLNSITIKGTSFSNILPIFETLEKISKLSIKPIQDINIQGVKTTIEQLYSINIKGTNFSDILPIFESLEKISNLSVKPIQDIDLRGLKNNVEGLNSIIIKGTNFSDILPIFESLEKISNLSVKPIQDIDVQGLKNTVEGLNSITIKGTDFSNILPIFESLEKISKFSIKPIQDIDVHGLKNTVESISSIKAKPQDLSGLIPMFESLEKLSKYSFSPIGIIDISGFKNLVENLSSIKIKTVDFSGIMPMLEALNNISKYSLSSIDIDISGIKSLIEGLDSIRIKPQDFSGIIPMLDILEKLSKYSFSPIDIDIINLKTLIEGLNSIEIKSQDFTNLVPLFTSLEKISGYSLPKIDVTEINNIKSMIEELSSININIPDFSSLKSLQDLQDLPDLDTAKLISIKTFVDELSKINITNIPDFSGIAPSLESLKGLSGISLGKIGNFDVSGFTNLLNELSKVKVISMPDFSGIAPSLESLKSLSGITLGKIDNFDIAGFTNLLNELSKVKITNIPDFSNIGPSLESLKSLTGLSLGKIGNFDATKLNELLKTLSNIQVTNIPDLSNVRIAIESLNNLPTESLSKLSKIKNIDITGLKDLLKALSSIEIIVPDFSGITPMIDSIEKLLNIKIDKKSTLSESISSIGTSLKTFAQEADGISIESQTSIEKIINSIISLEKLSTINDVSENLYNSLDNIISSIGKFEKVKDFTGLTKATEYITTFFDNIKINILDNSESESTRKIIASISHSYTELVNSIKMFSEIDNKAKNSFSEFLQKLLSLSTYKGKDSSEIANTLKNTLAIIGESIKTFITDITGGSKKEDLNIITDLSNSLASLHTIKTIKQSDFTNISKGLLAVSKTLETSSKDISAFNKEINNFNLGKLNKIITNLDKYNDGPKKKSKSVQIFAFAGALKETAVGLIFLSGAFLLFAAGMSAAGALLGVSPMGVLGYVVLASTAVALSMLIITGISSAGEKFGGMLSPKTEGLHTKNAVTSAKDMGVALMFIAGGILSFGVGMSTAAALLGTTVAGVGLKLIGTVAAVALSMLIITGVASVGDKKFGITEGAKDPIDNARNMGIALMFISGGILSFGLAMTTSAALLGTSVLGVGAAMLLIISGVALSILILSTMTAIGDRKFTGKGKGNSKDAIDNARGIGVAFMFIAGGILAFGLTMAIVPKLLKTDSIGKSVLLIGGIIIGMTALIALLGLAQKFIQPGIDVAKGIAMSIGFISLAVLAVAFTSSILRLMFKDDGIKSDGTKRTKVGTALATLGDAAGSLGIFGLFVAGLAGTLWVLGLPVVSGPIAIGAGALFMMAVSLIATTAAIKKTADIMKTMKTADIRTNVGDMISGVMGGVIDGVIGSGIAGDDNSLSLKELRQFRRVTRAIKMLRSVSTSLSKFAMSLKAFAEVGTVMELSYNEDGTPKLGKKIHVKDVSKSIADTFGTFITSLVSNTEGLKRRHARALKTLGKSLSGNKGILQGINDFANTLEIFAKFGAKGEVMSPIYNTEGEIISHIPVSINTITTNIVDAFGTFITQLISKSKQLTGANKNKLKDLNRALNGRLGILETIMSFSEAVESYAKYGKNNEIFVEGQAPIPVTTIVDNMLEGIGAFITKLSEKSADFEIGGRLSNKLTRFSEALVGSKKAFLRKEKPGILSAITEFSDLLTTYSETYKDGKIPKRDNNGQIIPNQHYTTQEIVSNMMSGIVQFITELSGKTKELELIEKQSRTIKNKIKSFAEVVTMFDGMTKSQQGLDTLASSMGSLADNVAKLTTNLNLLDTSKLKELSTASSINAKFAAQQPVQPAPVQRSVTQTSTKSTENWEEIAEKMAEKIGAKVAEKLAGINSGEYQFHFYRENEGTLNVKR